MNKQVLITCGGTSEPIDDVRVLTNISTGRFGHALAKELAMQPLYDVIEVCPKATLERLGSQPGVSYEHYRSTDDLQRALYERATPPSIILQAAAVSDYRPKPFKGKLSSDAEELTVQLERTPKLIAGLREHYGPQAFLVGFKLLSGVSRAQLAMAALKQLKDNRLNMVVANDLQDLKDGLHPILVVTAEGGVIPFTGTREEVARALADFIAQREQVNWFRSVKRTDLISSGGARERFTSVLNAVKAMNLLTDASGNISVRSDERRALNLRVSPRGVDKSLLTSDDGIPAIVDTDALTIDYSAKGKPSIDTGVESLLYEKYPQLDSIIHFHRGWGRMNVRTSFPYPCGVLEEAQEVIGVVEAAGVTPERQPLAVELIHHGFIVGFNDVQLTELGSQWAAVLEEFEKHLAEVTPPANSAMIPLEVARYRPIWLGSKIVGVIHDHPEAAVVYLAAEARGAGLGHTLIEQLIEREYTIQTVDDCEVREFYKRFGFQESSKEGIYWLTAPTTPLAKLF